MLFRLARAQKRKEEKKRKEDECAFKRKAGRDIYIFFSNSRVPQNWSERVDIAGYGKGRLKALVGGSHANPHDAYITLYDSFLRSSFLLPPLPFFAVSPPLSLRFVPGANTSAAPRPAGREEPT